MANIIDLILRLAVDSSKAKQQLTQDLNAIKTVGTATGQAISQATSALGSDGGAFGALTDHLKGISLAAPQATRGVQSIANAATSLTGAGAAAFSNMASALTATAKAAPAASQGLGGVGDAAGKGGSALEKFASQTTRANTSMEAFFGTLRGAATAIIGLGVVQTLKSWADQAARTQVLGTVLEQVALNAGISDTEVRELDANVQKLGITAEASRTALTSFIQSGLDVSKAAELARASQDLAVIAGQDSSTVFQRVILNVQQLDTVGLKYNGVIVQMETATKNYLKTLGEQSRELTRAEQQQALLEEVLRKSAEIAGVYEKSMGDVGKQLSSLNRYQKEAAISLGNNLLPAYLLIVQEFTTFLKQTKLITDSFGEQGEGAKQLAENLRPLVEALRQIAVLVVENISLIAQLVAGYLAFRTATIVLSAFTAVATQLGTVLVSIGKGFVALNAAINLIAAGGLPALTAQLVKFLGVAKAFLLTPLGAGIAALGVVIAGIYAYVEARKIAAKVDALTADGGKKLNEQMVDNLTERLNLVEKIEKSKAQQDLAQKRGDTDTVEAIKKELELSKERLKTLDEENAKLQKIADLKKIDTSGNAEQAKERKAIQATIKAADALSDTLTKLKIDSSDVAQGLDIGTEFGKQLGQAGQVFDAFADNVKNASGEVVVSIGQVQAATKDLLLGAKSFDEIQKALDLVEKRGQTSGPLFSNLIDTAKFNQAKVAITELDKTLGGYIGVVKEASENMTLLRGLAEDSASFVDTLRTSFLELGAGLEVSSKGIITVSGAIKGLAASRSELAQAEAGTTQQALASASERYRREAQNIEALRTKRLQIANDELSAKRNVDGLITAIDQDTTNKRIANAKTYYDALKTQQDQYTAKIRESISLVQSLENQRAENARSKEQAIFDLRLKGLNETQQRQAQQDRASELSTKARLALASGNLDVAKQAADDQVQMAQSLASSAKSAQELWYAEQGINRAYGDRDAVLAKQEQQAKAELALRIESQNAITTAMNSLRTTLSELSTGKDAQINLNVDRTQLDAVYQELDNGKSTVVTFKPDDSSLISLKDSVQKALEGIKFTLEGSASAVKAYASGGRITGPGTGTSDSILMWGSNGEFMMRQRAVDYYGENFMNMVNSMSLPKYAAGGLVGGDSTPGATNETVAIDLSVGGRSLGRVRGSRDTAKQLVSALRDLERGTS